MVASWYHHDTLSPTAPKINDFRKLWICSYLLKKSLMENFVFCAMPMASRRTNIHQRITIVLIKCYQKNYHFLKKYLFWNTFSSDKTSIFPHSILDTVPPVMNSFSLRISSVNVTKSAGHIYWRNPWWKISFFVQWKVGNYFRKTFLSYFFCWYSFAKMYIRSIISSSWNSFCQKYNIFKTQCLLDSFSHTATHFDLSDEKFLSVYWTLRVMT